MIFFLSVYLALYHRKRDVVGQQTSQPSCHRQFLNDDQVLGYFKYLDKVSLGSLINVQSFRQFDILIIKHEAKPVVCLDIVVIVIFGRNLSSCGITKTSLVLSHNFIPSNFVMPYTSSYYSYLIKKLIWLISWTSFSRESLI